MKTRIAVLRGFDDSFTVFAGDVARLGKERTAESWVVEDVSLGGFGAGVNDLGGEWPRIGSLLSLQPEGGDNWMLGCRSALQQGFGHACQRWRPCVIRARLERRAVAADQRFSSASGAIPGIWLQEADIPGEARMVLPSASFDVRENLEFMHDGRRYLLAPVELEEVGSGFEICRYLLAPVELEEAGSGRDEGDAESVSD